MPEIFTQYVLPGLITATIGAVVTCSSFYLTYRLRKLDAENDELKRAEDHERDLQKESREIAKSITFKIVDGINEVTRAQFAISSAFRQPNENVDMEMLEEGLKQFSKAVVVVSGLRTMVAMLGGSDLLNAYKQFLSLLYAFEVAADTSMEMNTAFRRQWEYRSDQILRDCDDFANILACALFKGERLP